MSSFTALPDFHHGFSLKLPSFLSFSTLSSIHQQALNTPYPLMHTFWPLAISVCYWLAVNYFQPSVAEAKANAKQKAQKRKELKAADQSKQWATMDYLILVHNVILCIFSAVIFYYSVFRGLLPLYRSHGFNYAVCHGFSTETLRLCHYAFYLSKYYEYFDTVILIAKGQRPILLSKYHHFGAGLIMWVLVVTQPPAGWIFAVFNSFIHTIMYAYYALTLCGYKPPFKPLVTVAQLTQFFTGVWLAIHITAMSTSTPSETFGMVATVGYTCSLIVLFSNFFWQTYLKKSVKEKQATKSMKSA